MSAYFKNMKTYYISYAAFSATEYSGENDYIRLRQYAPQKKGLTGTNINKDHFKTGLFKPFQTYHIKVFKENDTATMYIENKNNSSNNLTCKWDISNLPNYNEGRVGL